MRQIPDKVDQLISLVANRLRNMRWYINKLKTSATKRDLSDGMDELDAVIEKLIIVRDQEINGTEITLVTPNNSVQENYTLKPIPGAPEYSAFLPFPK